MEIFWDFRNVNFVYVDAAKNSCQALLAAVLYVECKRSLHVNFVYVLLAGKMVIGALRTARGGGFKKLFIVNPLWA
jgi:hypothetical protein